jgi:hypothetical protein
MIHITKVCIIIIENIPEPNYLYSQKKPQVASCCHTLNSEHQNMIHEKFIGAFYGIC